MDAEVHPLTIIFRSGTQFIAPPYQRWYEWDLTNLKEFWGDVTQAAEQERSAFMGPTFVYEIKTKFGDTITRYSVVDGQQRKTTITLLLAAIADEFARQGNEDEAAETRSFIFNARAKGLAKYRVLPKADHLNGRGRDRDTLFGVIDAGYDQTNIDPTCLIYKAHRYFVEHVAHYARSGKDLKVLRSGITRLDFSVHRLDHTKDDQLEIFKRLHERGRDISNADLFRNFIFQHVGATTGGAPELTGQHQNDFYFDSWLPFEMLLTRSEKQDIALERLPEFHKSIYQKQALTLKRGRRTIEIQSQVSYLDQFLYCYLCVLAGRHVQERDLHTEARRQFSKKTDSKGVVDELTVAAGCYRNLILLDQGEANPRVAERFRRVRMLNTNAIHPFLLRLYLEFRAQTLSEVDFIAVLDTVENYLLRRHVCRIQQTGDILGFAPNLYERTKGPGIVQEVQRFLVARNCPNDEDFSEALIRSPQYREKRNSKTLLLLQRLNDPYEHKEFVGYPPNTEIEHVCPQTLNPVWAQCLGDQKSKHASFKHLLGNLTLTAYNTTLAQRPFHEKKAIYRDSKFELNRYFEGKDQWRLEEIIERGEHLARQALQLWPDLVADREVVNQDDEYPQTPFRVFLFDEILEDTATWSQVYTKVFEAVASRGLLDVLVKFAEEFPTYVSDDTQDINRMKRPKRLIGGYSFDAGWPHKRRIRDLYPICARLVELVGGQVISTKERSNQMAEIIKALAE